LINNLKHCLAGRLLISFYRVSFLGEYAQKVGGNFLSKSQGARRSFSAPHKVRALFHAKGLRDLSPLRSCSSFYDHSNSCLTDILCPSLPHSFLTNFQATQITKSGADDMNASSFVVKNYAAREKPAGRIFLVALLALMLCPISVLAQSCPGTTSWNGGAGSWETAGNWSSGVPGATSSACISVASSTVNITATSGDTTDNLDINLGSDILNIGNNTQLTIQSGGNILNNGALNLNSGGNTTELIIAGATTLSGTGTVTMSNNTNNYITGGGTFTNKQTIQGAGNIGNNNLTFVNSGSTAIIDANVSSTLQINPNGGTTSTGTLEATAGGVLELSGSTVANTGGLIQASGTGSTVELNNVSITGGTLTSSSGGVIESINTWNTSLPTLTSLTISSGSTVNVPNNNGLALGAGTITNNGTINLQGTGNNTILVIAGSTTLGGTGTVTMGNNANNIIDGGGTLTNGETIQGAGTIGNGSLTLVNNGTIDATLSTALQVNPNGGTTNNGTMEASAGGTLELSGSTIANGSGLIEATGTSATVELNDVSITGGILTSSSGGVIESINNWNVATPTLTSVTISSGSTLDIPNNNGLNFGAGTITNNGAINLQGVGNNTELVIAGSTTLSGTGTVTMGNNANNIILGGGTLTNNQTIQGGGDIGDANLTLINNGTIDANQTTALTINPNGGTTNTKTLEATAGGTLVLATYAVNNAGGTILATGTGSSVQLNNVSITSGTLSSSLGGVIVSANTWNTPVSTLNNLTISSGTNVDIPNNNGLDLGTGTITNNGTFSLQSSGNNTELVITGGNVTLTGSGNVIMSSNPGNMILAGTSGLMLTNVNNTISGAGEIGGGTGMLFVNQASGIVNASGGTLTINPYDSSTTTGSTTNTGLLEATAGGVLQLENTITNTGGTILATGTSGGMSPTPSTVELNSVSITGGTLTSSSGGIIESINQWNTNLPTLTSLTISSGSTLDIPNNNGLALGAGTITNNGTINLQSTGNNTELVIAGSTTLSGTGIVMMSNNSANIFTGGGTFTNGETIEGAGTIGNGNLTFVNNGTVNATQPSILLINPNGGTTNGGTLEATAGGTLELTGSTVANTGGLIEATGGTVLLNNVSITGGTLTSSSGGVIESVNQWNTSLPTLTGLTISSGSTLDIPNNNGLNLGAGTVTNNGTINLQSGGNNTELVIAGSTTLSGSGTVTMSNFANNIITGGGTFTNGETIQGAGTIGNGNLTLVNNGTIDANQPTALTINANGNTTNTKTMEATAGGTLHLLDYTINNTGGTILATGTNSVVTLDAVSISGGTLTSSSGGIFESLNTWNTTVPTLTGVTISAGSTLDIPNNNGLDLGVGTITNKGTINLESGGNNTELVIDGNVTLAGTGKVIMSPNGSNMILGTGTLTNQNTIEGEGNIGDGQIGLINTGSILANETGTHTPSVLYIDTGAAGFTNNVGTKNGILNVSAKNTLIIEGGPFTNYSSGTLTGGTYMVTGTLEFAAGTGLVTNDAAITLTGATSEIFNTSNSTNALTTFADNGTKGSFTVNGFTFTDANVFTNSGTIAVGGGAKFDSTNQLTNFNSTTSTLTGGTYNITGTGQFQFNNQGDTSDIITNAAHITLSGVDTTKPSFVDQSNNNALANFNANASTGSLTLSADRQFTTGGNLTNAGTVTVSKSTGTGTTKLIVNGSYTQTGSGTTTVDGVLSTSTGINVSGGFIYGNAAGITNGTQGTLIGNFDLTGGTINPGDGIKKIGDLNITGTYTQSGAGILNIDLDGTTTGKWDVLNVSGAAAVGGTLNVDALTGFTPTNGETFDILNASSVTGTFSTVDCSFSNGDSCSVTYNPTDVVVTITGGAVASASQGAVSASPAHRVSRASGDLSASSTKEPAAILSRATCFAARMIGSACGDKASAATASHGGDMHEVASARTELNSAHNNVMVATRSISSGRGGASHETSASASAMARLYVCAYMPSSVGHTMGCN
jgi:fibronectin-binding autotransporter adhesin